MASLDIFEYILPGGIECRVCPSPRAGGALFAGAVCTRGKRGRHHRDGACDRAERLPADILRRADAIFIEELHAADLYHQVSQAFAVFLPVKSVGVTGDGRRYEWVISLRAVETVDFM